MSNVHVFGVKNFLFNFILNYYSVYVNKFDEFQPKGTPLDQTPTDNAAFVHILYYMNELDWLLLLIIIIIYITFYT